MKKRMDRRERKQRKKIIIFSCTLLVCGLSVGYAAFSTSFNINGKGTIVSNKKLAAEALKETVVNSGDGLYKDIYEEGRYVYKGASPANYITFNNETWRIISVESDETLKIMRNENIGEMAWNSNALGSGAGSGGTDNSPGLEGPGSMASSNKEIELINLISEDGTSFYNIEQVLLDENDWEKSSTLKTYLNGDYYNTLTTEAKGLIQSHTWGVGTVTDNNTDLAGQITSENSKVWIGNIALISVSDYLRANTNTEQCGNLSINNTNKAICKTTNWIYNIIPTGSYLWTVSPSFEFSCACDVSAYNSTAGGIGYGFAFKRFVVASTLYLTSNITLEGEGTLISPYTIIQNK